MSEHDTELLSQYLDGELGAQQVLLLKQRLLAEPELRAALAQMQQVDNALRNAFDVPGTTSVPAHVSALLSPAETADHHPQRRAAWGLALAASVLAASGLLFKSTQFASIDSAGDAHFANALETSPSRSAGWDQLADGRQLRAVLSFNTESHGWCREYLLAKAGQYQHGVACRGEGEWTEVALSPDLQDIGLADSANQYRPAGAANPDAIQQFVDQNASSLALSASEEAELLARGWR